MRYYLDTNILVFLITDQTDEIRPHIKAEVFDYGSQMLTSSLCVAELVTLIQLGKVRIPKCKDTRRAAETALRRLDELGVEVKPPTLAHARELLRLPFFKEHGDPADRLIIAQAVADRIPIVTSDTKFHLYQDCGLQLVFNKR